MSVVGIVGGVNLEHPRHQAHLSIPPGQSSLAMSVAGAAPSQPQTKWRRVIGACGGHLKSGVLPGIQPPRPSLQSGNLLKMPVSQQCVPPRIYGPRSGGPQPGNLSRLPVSTARPLAPGPVASNTAATPPKEKEIIVIKIDDDDDDEIQVLAQKGSWMKQIEVCGTSVSLVSPVIPRINLPPGRFKCTIFKGSIFF